MTTKENARWQAGVEDTCATNSSTLTYENWGLRANLWNLGDPLGHDRATVTMIELERPKLPSQLLSAGWHAHVQQGGAV